MRFWITFLWCAWSVAASCQTYEEIKNRYDKYLNCKGSLDKWVDINPSRIILYNYFGGKKQIELLIKKEDWCNTLSVLNSLTADSLEKHFAELATPKKLATDCKRPEKKLREVRIMIDPGHMAGDLEMAHIEQKYLHLTKANDPSLLQDSLDIAEGMLTFQTASILKNMLEEKGATVALTRKNNSTSFGISYPEWFKSRRKNVLDSLLATKKMDAQRHRSLLKMDIRRFFLEFFKDYELVQRSKVINAYRPDLTVIIHYNVDEKNAPWLKTSNKNFCMAFIPGCLTRDNLETKSGKINFLRLLLSDDIMQSEKISALTVNELSKNLNIPVAKNSDAGYLADHCTATSSPGVFSRNLALCRLVKTPLVYGECLYQDCDKECYELLKNTETKYGIQTNKRVVLAAQSFFNAVVQFYSK